MDILITILTVQFIVLFFYWGGVGVKSLFKDKPIIIEKDKPTVYIDMDVQPVSKGDKVNIAFIKDGKYVANIINPLMERNKLLKADSQEELRKKIESVFKAWAVLNH